MKHFRKISGYFILHASISSKTCRVHVSVGWIWQTCNHEMVSLKAKTKEKYFPGNFHSLVINVFGEWQFAILWGTWNSKAIPRVPRGIWGQYDAFPLNEQVKGTTFSVCI